MRLVRTALALALASTALALAAPSVASAASLPTPTRIVLFTGGGNATPVGPAVQPARLDRLHRAREDHHHELRHAGGGHQPGAHRRLHGPVRRVVV